MKPYGIPRIPELEFLDVADIQRFGLKSSAGHCFKASGDYKSYTKNSKARKRVRRAWKKKERNKQNKILIE